MPRLKTGYLLTHFNNNTMSKEGLSQFIANAEPQKTFEDITQKNYSFLEYQSQSKKQSGTKLPTDNRFDGICKAVEILTKEIRKIL